jgi:serine/threonine protein kinase/WD40 repeat protein
MTHFVPRVATSSEPISAPNRQSRMAKIVCLYCRHVVENPTDSPSQCPHCGRTFPIAEDSTQSRLRGASTLIAPPVECPRQIGRYLIEGELGKGGFGSVFLARDPELDRLVAIKVPRADTGQSADALERFAREGRSAAQLKHPGIVPVFNVEHEGTTPFIVSEYVEGETLNDRLKNGPAFSCEQSARLLADVADAVAYAHSRGVIHRDIKPSNILIACDGTPRLLDFGLARRESIDESITAPHHIIGTPGYMSPEQAWGQPDRVDRRTDIYSLGVVFYQLLTGEMPFRGEPRMILRQVIEEDPRNLRSLKADIPPDLETICEKAMEKELSRRFQSCEELSAELGRWIRQEPILSRPVTRIERAWRWCKRNPATSTLAASIAGLLIMFALGATGMYASEHRHRTQVEQLLDEKSQLLDEKSELLSKSYVEKANRYLSPRTETQAISPIMALPWLYSAMENDKHNPRRWEASRIRLGMALRQLPRVERIWVHQGGIATAAISPRGDRLATGGDDGTLYVWNLAKDEPVAPAMIHPAGIRGVTFTPDEKSIATGCSDGSIRQWETETGKLLVGPSVDIALAKTHSTDEGTQNVRVSAAGQSLLSVRRENAQVWDILTGGQIGKLMVLSGANSIQLADSGKLLVAGTSRSVGVWDVQTGKEKYHLQDAPSLLAPVIAADGITVAVTEKPELVRLWDCRSGKNVAVPLVHSNTVSALQFSPDGTLLATSTVDGTLYLWNAKNGVLVWKHKVAPLPVGRLHFRRDGTQLAAVSPLVRTIWIVNVDDGLSVAEPIEISSHPQIVAWTHEGFLLTAGADGAVRLWRTGAEERARQLPHTTPIAGSAVSANRRTLATVDRGGLCCIMDLDRIERTRVSDVQSIKTGIERATAVALSADGSKAAFANSRVAVSLWDVAAGTKIRDIDPGGPIGRPMPLSGDRLAFLTDDRSLIHVVARMRERSCRISIWDINTNERLRSERFDLDGEFSDCDVQNSLCAVGGGKQVIAYDPTTGRRIGPILSHPSRVAFCRISPDGKRVLTGCHDGVARIWSLSSGNVMAATQRQSQEIICGAFSADITRFATGCADGTSRIWSTRDAAPLTGSLNHGVAVTGCCFSPNSRWLLTTSGDAGSGFESPANICGWDGSTGEPLFVLPLNRLTCPAMESSPTRPPRDSALRLVSFSTDSRDLHVGRRDGLFTTLTLEPDARPAAEILRDIILRSGTRPDGAGGLATAASEDLLRVFRRDQSSLPRK